MIDIIYIMAAGYFSIPGFGPEMESQLHSNLAAG